MMSAFCAPASSISLANCSRFACGDLVLRGRWFDVGRFVMCGEDDELAFADGNSLEPAAIDRFVAIAGDGQPIRTALVKNHAGFGSDFIANGVELPAIHGGLISAGDDWNEL